MRYSKAEWVPWAYLSPEGAATFYKGQNKPEAVVLHIAQGYASTARSWALEGHFGASWHFTVCKDGTVLQHLDFHDGGYHAGIPVTAPTPRWNLWKGHGINVNKYTIGIEHEGFSGAPWPEEQRQASKDLCLWLAETLGIPLDIDHFPPHAAIDVVNRVNDFGPPEFRAEFYEYLFHKEDDMADPRLEKIIAALGGEAAIDEWNAKGNSLLLGFANDQARIGALEGQVAEHQASPHGSDSVPEHQHGGVVR